MSNQNQASIFLPINSKRINVGLAILIFLVLVGFSILFVLVDNAYYTFADARFPNVGTSAELATLWGAWSLARIC